ncbi:MAG TPA: magnesium/cobalt transporter CorA [Kiloniellales bacterium]
MTQTRAKSAVRSRRKLPSSKRAAPPGSSPGTLIADPSATKPDIHLIGYGPESVEERDIEDVRELQSIVGKSPVTWVNVDGLGDVEVIRALGKIFGLHRLTLEDVVNVHQRPKVENYSDHAFIVTRMIKSRNAPETEQISMFLGEGFLLTFQERKGDCFDLIRERIRRNRGILRESKADYLAYTLIDAVMDSYFPVLEAYGERLEALEDSVMAEPSARQVSEIHNLKRDLLLLRRAIWPQREMINGLTRQSSPFVSEQTEVYLRDCYDHAFQLMDILETYREVAFGLVDVYLSSMSARMNEIMKVLTIIATIFIPLGFIASLYGMNFDYAVSPWNMPELHWYLGYPFALGLMVLLAGVLLYNFRRKGWIGPGRSPGRP